MSSNLVETVGLTTLVECYQPLLHEIARFLSHKPEEFVQFSCLTKHIFSPEGRSAFLSQWENMLAIRWPGLYECLKYNGTTDWYAQYKDVFLGRAECVLEVFEREKNVGNAGFSMAAMPAKVRFERRMCHDGSYVARYLSATEALPERIPIFEEQRLRFLPASARSQFFKPEICARDPEAMVVNDGVVAAYPYKVLEGIQGLCVGKGVELQWKMQSASPFGWWYGHLEALESTMDEKVAIATITFQHFPVQSRWYRLKVRFGDGETRSCEFGGYTGGLRGIAAEAENKQWMLFFPQGPLSFS